MYKSLLFLIVFFLSLNLKAEERPNILWVTIEDTSPNFIGCYGNKDARTPVIDKLAEEGVRFINAFSTGTVCSPSRTAIITGVKTYKTGTGNHRSKYPVPDFMKGFPYYLQQAGYYTTNNKKTDYNVKNETDYIKEAWDECSGDAGWWNRMSGQPFFAVFNFISSHQSRTMTESYSWYKENVLNMLKNEEQIGDNEFKIPPFYLDSPEMRKQFARVYNSIKLTDNEIGGLIKKLEGDGLKDSTIIFFYADHGEGMPRGKTNGINYGHRVPFIVWFPEMYKHLSPWGTGGIVTDELVDFTDLAPTVISLANGKVPDHMVGRKLIGEERSKTVNHLILSSDRSDNGIDMTRTVTNGKYVYSRNFKAFMPELKYIRYMEIGEIKQQMRNDFKNNKLNKLQSSLFAPRPAEFLFDIDADPWETKNLASDPKYKQLLEKMRKTLKIEMLQSKDVLLLPEYQIEALSETTTAYEYHLSDDYKTEEILDAAWLSGFRGESIIKQQLELLKDNNPVVRYWATIGLRCQNMEDLTPYLNQIGESMDDTYLPVAVTASSIIYNQIKSIAAEQKLKNFCKSENMHIALMAVNYLLYTDNKQPFIKTIELVRGMENRTYNVKAACADFLGSLGLIPNNTNYKN